MTKSEYDKHMGSLAVATAVHLSVGGDLVIIGMSLGDPYLRDAILQNRRWLRRVYWLGEANDYSEWSRVAEVTFVEVPHTEVWTRLGRTILHADQTGELKKVDTEMRQKGVQGMLDAANQHRALSATLRSHAKRLVAVPHANDAKVTEFAEYCIAAGYDVPDVVRNDHRCKL